MYIVYMSIKMTNHNSPISNGKMKHILKVQSESLTY